ncbi:MAG: hypothetical protein EA402_01995 [Planctomycetota bacterium]|nr:MAG: hypothetical protein EA402_01995 [Planctomycetota bacterium]
MSRDPAAPPQAIAAFIAGTLAMARLTVLEATRQRFWWLVIAGMVGLLLLIPRLTAVDEAAQVKLSVAAVAGTIGFITTLASVFLVVVSVRRDLETRCSFMLFSKPLSRLGYCLGRWLGTVVAMAVAMLLLSLAGVLAIALQLGSVPRPLSLSQVDNWSLIDGFGGLHTPRADLSAITLDQRPGSGLRAHFRGLGDQPGELLVKAMVRSRDGFSPHATTPIQIALLHTDQEGVERAQLLAPLGESDPAKPVLLRHRGLQRTDLQVDYIRFAIPSEFRQGSGDLRIQMLRLDGEAVITVPRRDGIILAHPGPAFLTSMFIAGFVQLAHTGILAAAALLLVLMAGIGTSLLGCLTLFFGAHAVGFIAEVSASPQTGLLARRLIDLLVPVIPDFSRFPVAAQLAAAQAVSPFTILSSWLYFGIWTLVLLALAWIALRRKEL